MTDKKHFQFRTRTKAGEVRGTVNVFIEGPVDGMTSMVERIGSHVMGLPVDEVKAVDPGEADGDEDEVGE